MLARDAVGSGIPTRKTHPTSVLQDGAFSGQHGMGASDMFDMVIALADDKMGSAVTTCATPVTIKTRSETTTEKRLNIR